jgi:hypothetical protein
MSFKSWLSSVFQPRLPIRSSRKTLHWARPTLEALEDRVVPAFNLTIGTGATTAVSVLNGTFTATGTGANINVADIRSALLAGQDVVISNGSSGAETGNIDWASTASTDLNLDGIGTRSLSIIADASSASGASIDFGPVLQDLDTSTADRLNLTLSGAGNGIVNLTGTTATPGDVSITGTDIVSTAGVIDTTSGTGKVSLTAGRSISLAGGAIRTSGGDVTLTANQGATPAAGNFVGVDLQNYVVSSVTGAIRIQGRGGDNGDKNIGVRQNNDVVKTTGSVGDITITGTGGSGSGASNIGVQMTGPGKVTTEGAGNVIMDGTSPGTGVTSHGIQLLGTPEVHTDGTGAITMTGVSGTGAGSNGVSLETTNFVPQQQLCDVFTSEAPVTITGTATGPNAEHGIYLANGSRVAATGGGALTMTGTPGGAAGAKAIKLNLSTQLDSSGPMVLTANGGGIQDVLAGWRQRRYFPGRGRHWGPRLRRRPLLRPLHECKYRRRHHRHQQQQRGHPPRRG